MYQLIAIGDPIIDTHVQIDNECSQCRMVDSHGPELCLEYGGKIPIIDSFQNLGGNAPNVAVAASKLGLKTALVSTIGDDSNGRMVLEYLKNFKVDNSLVTTEAGADTRYSIILNYRGERTILSYSEKKKYVWPEPIPETDWIYYTGLSEGFDTIQTKLLAHLDSHSSIRLAINPGSYMLKYALKNLREAVARADILIVNLEEAEKVSGTTLVKAKTISGLMRSLMELNAKEVVLTDGSKGAWAGNKDEIWHLDTYPVTVVAKTGAGDAFSAAYLTARLAGHDLGHALEWGTANSCSVIQRHGSQTGLADQTGIKKMIAQFPNILPKQL